MSLQRVLFVLLLSMATGCGRDEPAAAGAGAAAFPPADVQTVTLEPKPVPRSSEFVGTVQSLRSTTVQPQVEGFVRRIFVKAGDRVSAGTPLVQIDPERQQATLQTTESQRAARQADLTLAKQQLDRAQVLFKTGAVSREQLDQAESTHATAEAQLKAIEAQIRENQVELQYYRVTAPTSGIVGEIPIRVGDRVTPTTNITTIDQSAGLEAHINVPLERASDLKPGLTVDLLGADGSVLASNPIFDGLLAPEQRFTRWDPGSLAERIRTIADMSPAERTTLGRGLRERVAERHSVQSWARGILDAAGMRIS